MSGSPAEPAGAGRFGGPAVWCSSCGPRPGGVGRPVTGGGRCGRGLGVAGAGQTPARRPRGRSR
ncbi:hypothetical protein EF913_32190 [Streptomyces sp. WAC04189]|nr:hypothetical protein EF913_32190 [Streptomyces sp. WAC04189]